MWIKTCRERKRNQTRKQKPIKYEREDQWAKKNGIHLSRNLSLHWRLWYYFTRSQVNAWHVDIKISNAKGWKRKNKCGRTPNFFRARFFNEKLCQHPATRCQSRKYLITSFSLWSYHNFCQATLLKDTGQKKYKYAWGREICIILPT